MVNTELKGCGRVTEVVETDCVKTGGVNKRPGKPKAVVGGLVVLTGVTVADRASGKNGVENVEPEGEVVPKRCKP